MGQRHQVYINLPAVNYTTGGYAQFDRSVLAGMREQQLRDTAIAQWQRDAAQQKGDDNGR